MKQIVPIKTIREHVSLAKDRTTVFLDNHRVPTAFTPRNRQPTVLPFKSRLCTDCQRWDNPTIIFKPTFEPTIMSLERILLNKECITCRVIGLVILDKLHATGKDFHAVPSIRAHMGPTFHVQNLKTDDPYKMEHHISNQTRRGNSIRCVVYLQIQDNRTDPEPSSQPGAQRPSPSISVQLSLSYQSKPTQLTQVKTWDTPFFDTKIVKRWIAKCKNHHRDCKSFEGTLAPGFRLIDVEKLCVTEPSHLPSFVALSYMWTSSLGRKDLQLCQGNLQHLQVPGGIDVWALPDVVADTMRLCKDLGERYLWVDRLCIVQDDSCAKHAQINAMGSVYGMASLTIVAVADPTQTIGLPGIRGRPRRPFIYDDTRLFNVELRKVDMNPHVTVDHSAWNTRAWTFQERILSLRCLYITDFQVYFTCPGILFQEEIDVVLKGETDDWGPGLGPSLPWIIKTKQLDGYLKYVSQYTTRTLSYQTDILNAFAGISHVLSKQFGTRFVFGLPEKYFTQALLWYNPGHEARRSGVPEIPSWSWAAWSGPAHFSNLCLSGGPIDERYTGVLAKFQIQDPEKGLQPLAIKETWFREHESSFPDDQQIDFHESDFNWWKHMPEISTTISVWKSCLQNPWDLYRHTPLDPAACALARKYPGCLVFNTTVATLCLQKATGSHGEGSELLLHLCNEEHREIGCITTGREWAEEVIGLEKKHSFIVLCAGLLPKHDRKHFQSDRILPSGVAVESPWLLMVMLIQRDGGVARRLGLGYVETTLWGTAEPKWETIVLT